MEEALKKRIFLTLVSFLVLVMLLPATFAKTHTDTNFDDPNIQLENTEVAVVNGENVIRLRENIPENWLQTNWSQGAYKTGDNIYGAENVELELVKADNIADHIVISEIYWEGVASEDSEFIELYNPTDNSIDLSTGWTLHEESKGIGDFNLTGTIPAYGFYLVGFADGFKDNSSWPNADQNADSSLTSGELIWLTDGTGTLVDNTGVWSGGGEGESVVRKAASDAINDDMYEANLGPTGGVGKYVSSGNGYDNNDPSNFVGLDNTEVSVSYAADPENSAEIESPAGEYKSSGKLISSIFDAGITVNWENIEWTASEPTVTEEDIDNVGSEPDSLIDGTSDNGVITSGSLTDTREKDGTYEEIGEQNIAVPTENTYNENATKIENGSHESGGTDNLDADDETYYEVSSDNSLVENIADNVVVFEFAPDPPGGDPENEHVEFYNPTGSSVSLDSWEYVVDGSTEHTFGADNSIAAHGFFLLASDWGEGYTMSPPADAKDTLSLTNGGATVVLKDDAGNTIDNVDYTVTAPDGEAWERKAQSSSTSSSMRDGDSSDGNGYDTDAVIDSTSGGNDFVNVSCQPQNTDNATEDPPSVHFLTIRHDSGVVSVPSGETVDNIEVTLNLITLENSVRAYFEIWDWKDSAWDPQTSSPIDNTAEDNLIIQATTDPDNYIHGTSDNIRVRLYTRGEENHHRIREDYLEYKVTSSESDYRLNWEHRIENVQTGWQDYTLRIYGYSDSDENVGVYVWDNSNSHWRFIENLPSGSADWVENTIRTSYLDVDNLSLRYFENDNDSTQTTIHIDYATVKAENTYASSADVYARTSADASTWTNWETYSSSPAPIGFGDNRYVQYKVELSTEDNSITPSLEDIRINYLLTPENGTYTSQSIRTDYVSSWSLSWNENVPSGSSLNIRTRSSENADNDQLWSAWSSPLDNTDGTAIPSPSGGRKYLQIKAELSREDLSSPSPRLENFKLTYTPDTKAPKIENLDYGAASSEARISAVLSDNSPIDTDNIELYLDGQRLWPSYNSSTGEVAIELLLEDGVHSANLKAADHHGQASEKSWTFTVRSEPPNPPVLDNLPRTVGEREIEVTGTLDFKEEVGGGWSEKRSNPPVGVADQNGHRMAEMNGKVYFWTARGGKPGTAAEDCDNFYKYDPSTDSWTQLADAPFGSAYGISTAAGVAQSGENAIYIIKGYWTGQKTWFARYTESGGWETLDYSIPFQKYPDVAQNYPRNGSTLVWDRENYIYFFPGSGYENKQHDWYRYHIDNDSWEYMGELPMWNGVGNASTFVEGEGENYIYAMLGSYHFGEPYRGWFASDYNGAKFMRYGLSSENWEVLDNCGPGYDHPYGADDGSALAWDDGDYIYHTPGAYEEMTKDLEENQKRKLMRYSISGDSWTEMGEAPYNEYGGWDDGGGIVMLDNTIYALKGGSDIAWAEDNKVVGGGGVPASDFWSYSPPQTSRIAENKVRIYLNDNYVTTTPVASDGTFSAKIKLKVGESNRIKARAIDLDGNPSTFSEVQTVELDLAPPGLTINYPPKGFFRRIRTLELSGRVNDSTVENVVITLENKTITAEVTDYQFKAELTLENGTNLIIIRATDAAGNTVEVTRQGTYAAAPPDTSVTIQDVKTGVPQVVTFENHPFIREIEVTSQEDLDNLTLAIEGISDLPSGTLAPPDVPYAYLRITSTPSGVMDETQVTFRVESYWLDTENISLTSIRLDKFDEGWSSLSTEFDREQEGWAYYSATPDSFSLFSITGEPVKPSPPPTPWVMILFGVVGVVIVALVVAEFVRRHKSRPS